MFSNNVTVIGAGDKSEIAKYLHTEEIHGGHFTNGIYSAPADLIVPTTLAGFRYIEEKYKDPGDCFFIGMNSDISVAQIMDAKKASDQERAAQETQIQRIMKMHAPMSHMFPNTRIVFMMYDEETPNELYNFLFEELLELKSLHKWGFGTKPDAPKIEGAHLFKKVLAFPLVNDLKPVCHGITVSEDQSSFVDVVKLHETNGRHAKPYLSTNGKVLFPVPEFLDRYAEPISFAPLPAFPNWPRNEM